MVESNFLKWKKCKKMNSPQYLKVKYLYLKQTCLQNLCENFCESL